ncbi:hypothetical protein RV11_GL002489 [Enterococcus phoeniculicola]|jgi:uncharacterized lipoprotein NlpE involved in copper resistance|uniref:Lipoprotein n=1 Tax=Enterococcus phoeniculicola ATCC BAA-412 TaxID=1158610 RepID=R3WSD6_9ENTE|nr:hypothetical protein [Enterococcus phoeniculicola]EOL44740.1 hypothetical protein UC3_01557 [Enterococcus phoeniculicola ATCC BAA-412]EOT75029.1 hypothetical protein I589_02629 [Enterococcus phoeniculicola ATCC BAA-412]OJG72915.1 hypothetical protein RV11_GL002489 [Enterococcus phoeniculicola]
MKKFSWVICLLFVFLLVGCSQKKDGEIDSRVYKLETDFKENYQLWVDIKADGSIQYKEYALDIKSTGSEFKRIGNLAKTSTYKKMLSEGDQEIYETYRLLGKDIYDVGYNLYYGKKEEAKKLYEKILNEEEKLKE